MKKYFVLILVLFVFASAKPQNNGMAIADIDMDGTADTVHIDGNDGVIVCRLSHSGFEPQLTLTIKSLLGNDLSPFIGLSAESGTIHLSFLGNRATNHYIFVYDKRRKTIYLSECWFEQLGDIIGSGASEFKHDLRRGRVNYSVSYYDRPLNPDHYDKKAYVTKSLNKRVEKIHLPFEEFSVDTYYQKTDYIWEEIYSIK